MTLDVRAQGMAHGEALLEAPIGELIYRVAASIAEAQLKLDQVGVRVATLLSETKVPFVKEDGTAVDKSLLELGFLPPFYAFTETDIEVKMTLTLKVEEEIEAGGNAQVGDGATPGSTKRVMPFAAAISADYHRKYDFDMSGSSLVRTKLVSLPPPSVFLETLREHARASASGPQPDAAPAPPAPAPDPDPDPAPAPAPDPAPPDPALDPAPAPTG